MARQNDVCGHLALEHCAKGMCNTCYTRALYQANPVFAERKRELTRRGKHKKLPTPTRTAPKECEVCGETCVKNTVLCLDHCHATGQFRGWLCNKCNTGLGRLGDNLAGLQRAVAYLQRNGDVDYRADDGVFGDC